MSITTLPAEMIYDVFARLDPTSLFRCTHVNQLFRQIARDSRLLQKLFPEETFTQGKTITNWCMSPIETKEDLLKCVRTFFAHTTFGTPRILIVQSHEHTSMEISLEYGEQLKEPVQKKVRLLSNVLPTHSEPFSKERAVPRKNQWPLTDKRAAVRLTNTVSDELRSETLKILAEQVNTLDGNKMYSWAATLLGIVFVSLASELLSRFF